MVFFFIASNSKNVNAYHIYEVNFVPWPLEGWYATCNSNHQRMFWRVRFYFPDTNATGFSHIRQQDATVISPILYLLHVLYVWALPDAGYTSTRQASCPSTAVQSTFMKREYFSSGYSSLSHVKWMRVGSALSYTDVLSVEKQCLWIFR